MVAAKSARLHGAESKTIFVLHVRLELETHLGWDQNWDQSDDTKTVRESQHFSGLTGLFAS